MFNKRKKYKEMLDRELLDAIFKYEAEWKRLHEAVERGVDPLIENRNRYLLVQSQYMFLLREAKRRDITYLRY